MSFKEVALILYGIISVVGYTTTETIKTAGDVIDIATDLTANVGSKAVDVTTTILLATFGVKTLDDLIKRYKDG